MRQRLLFAFFLLTLASCATPRPILRPREVIGHAATGNVVILLARTWTEDGSVHLDMEVSAFPLDPLDIRAGRNLEIWIDGKRYQLSSREPGVEQLNTDLPSASEVDPESREQSQRRSARHTDTNSLPFRAEKFESVWYLGLPSDFVAAVGRATSVKGRLTGTKGVQNFEFTRVLLRQFHDWTD